MPKVLIMAGGTGGHIYPGVAVAQVLRAQGWSVAWMGNEEGMEGKIIPAYGYELAWIRFGALRGKGLIRKLLLPLNLLRGFWQAFCALRRVRPDVVVGMGGYVTFPGGMMAVLLNIPFVVHEQNSIAGLANRALSGVADKVLSGFPDVLKKAQWLGNPVREDIAALPAPAERFAAREGALRILVVGGSLGAQSLNQVVPAALALIEPAKRPVVTHQSGAKQLDDLRAAYANAGVEGELLAFIEDMNARYASADLVICRAGALTVAELAAAGVGSVLVPYPHAVDDHQTGNARFLSEHGAATLCAQKDLTAQWLADYLMSVDRSRLLQMAQAARSVARASAAEDVARVCEQLYEKKKS